MVTEDYVSYEIAKLLKEKGFEGVCNFQYSISSKTLGLIIPSEWYNENYFIPAPTLQMAMKWLRGKGIYIQIRRSLNTYLYGAIIMKDGTKIYATIPSTLVTYEELVEAALKYVLENLIYE